MGQPGHPPSDGRSGGIFTTQRFAALTPSLSVESAIPDRYRVHEVEGLLACTEAPTLRVRVERGSSVNASGLRSAAPGTIFLDGAAQAPPLVDTERGIINLDHHEGCVRAFTLACCEQALVLVAKGFDLQAREWTIHANEPDLDTLIAIWVLLNHRRIQKPPPHLLGRLVPLVRVEGGIDVHGLEHRHLTGLPADIEQAAFAALESLREVEVKLKASGEWSTADFAQYVLERLRFLDCMLYRPSDFERESELEELGRAELPDQKLAIACRSKADIYRVEEQLREIYGERLGIVVLEKEPGLFTLRQTKVFSRSRLDRIYERLNLLDPAAGNSRSRRRWGGSAEIGGSPRGAPSRLSVPSILAACRDACLPIAPGARVSNFLLALGAAGSLCVLAFALSLAAAALGPAVEPLLLTGTALTVGSLALLPWRRPGIAGLRLPAGATWLWAVPVATLGAVSGGAWLTAAPPQIRSLAAVLPIAIGSELLFRGVVYGIVLSRVAGHSRRWYSSPAALSTLLYVIATVALAHALAGWRGPAWLLDLPSGLPLAIVPLSAALFGASLGWIRERSESLLAPVLVHVAAVAVMTFHRL